VLPLTFYEFILGAEVLGASSI